MPKESPLPTANAIVQLQTEAVQRWHQQDIDNRHTGLMHLVCQQHASNFRLWHQEDQARSPTASDTQIASVKRSIDALNQQRNDQIELIDDAITNMLASVVDATGAKQNTETPGSAIDRLSIMSLRLFHYREQADRAGINDNLRQSVADRINVCQRQQSDLSQSLQELLDDLIAGRKRHRVYRQMKMYNDPLLNPAIYDADEN
ncbi:MAG: DUF4254 domain-containing protein [Pirellulaceae bacterium]